MAASVLASPVVAGTFVGLGPTASVVDIGFNEETSEVIAIGYEGGVPTVFRIHANTFAVERSQVVGTHDMTRVTGISPDGHRIAGSSNNDGASFSERFGLTWLADSPESPISIGSVDGTSPYSRPSDAWRDGVVGSVYTTSGFTSRGFQWNVNEGATLLPEHPNRPDRSSASTNASEVSRDGAIIVGTLHGASGYWMNGEARELTNFRKQTRAFFVSPGGKYIGGQDEFCDFDTFECYFSPEMWRRNEDTGEYGGANVYNPSLLERDVIVDAVSDSGFALGLQSEPGPGPRPWAETLIWNVNLPYPNYPEELRSWLGDRGVLVPIDVYSRVILDNPLTDGLILALGGTAEQGIVFVPRSIPEPAAVILGALAGAVAITRNRVR